MNQVTKFKAYKVGFRGTSNFYIIAAISEKDAKQKFADMNKIQVSGYIQIKRN